MKIEIARSFSRKLNLGGYETLDVFCSAKKEVEESEMITTSKYLQEFCQTEVMKDINAIRAERNKMVNQKAIKADKKDRIKEDVEISIDEVNQVDLEK